MRFQVFGLLMMIMCPGFLIVFAGQTKQQIESTRWPSVEGAVDGAFPKQTWTEKRIPRYCGRVAYHYTVEGQRYSSDLTDLGPGAWHDTQEEALNDVSQYQPGMTVRVYYDPGDPKIGVLETGIPQTHLVLLLVLGFGTIAATIGSIFTIRSWVKRYQGRKVEPGLSG